MMIDEMYVAGKLCKIFFLRIYIPIYTLCDCQPSQLINYLFPRFLLVNLSFPISPYILLHERPSLRKESDTVGPFHASQDLCSPSLRVGHIQPQT